MVNAFKLSIVIPTYNSAKTLQETLESVVNQTFKSFECIIIDGNSKDETPSIAQGYAEKHEFIHFVSEPDKGIYDAMNKGIKIGRGDYLYFMGGDDVLYNNIVLEELFSLPCFHNTQLIYGDVIFKHSKIRVGEEKSYLKLIKNLENISHQSIFYSRELFEKIGSYDLRFPIYADYNFNIKCFKNPDISKKYVNAVICIFNEKGTSYSQRNKDRFIENVHSDYVYQHEDPVALYDTVKYLEHELATVYVSKNYLIGKKIGDTVRKVRFLLKKIKIACI